MFWDMKAAEKLLEQRYPWFLPVFRAYPKVVLQGEVLAFSFKELSYLSFFFFFLGCCRCSHQPSSSQVYTN